MYWPGQDAAFTSHWDGGHAGDTGYKAPFKSYWSGGRSGDTGYKDSSRSTGEQLASRLLRLPSKKFFIDLKENKHGKFIKITETSVDGRKSKLLFQLLEAGRFRDLLKDFAECSESGQYEHGGENLKTAVIQSDFRRYYIDLKENRRGRFLKVNMVPLSNQRSEKASIGIPANVIMEFHDKLAELLDAYSSTDHVNDPDRDEGTSLSAAAPTQPARVSNGPSMRAGGKDFFFHVGANERGQFLRITEVRTNYRSSVMVPSEHLKQFCDMVTTFLPPDEAPGSFSAGTSGEPGLSQQELSGNQSHENDLETGRFAPQN